VEARGSSEQSPKVIAAGFERNPCPHAGRLKALVGHAGSLADPQLHLLGALDLFELAYNRISDRMMKFLAEIGEHLAGGKGSDKVMAVLHQSYAAKIAVNINGLPLLHIFLRYAPRWNRDTADAASGGAFRAIRSSNA
jgi:hypothetical protein